MVGEASYPTPVVRRQRELPLPRVVLEDSGEPVAVSPMRRLTRRRRPRTMLGVLVGRIEAEEASTENGPANRGGEKR